MNTGKSKPRNTDLDRALGQRVRELRRRQGDSQADLASKLDLTYQQVQKYENGGNRISALMLVKLADVLGTTPTDLLRSVDSAPPALPAASDVERLLKAFSRIRTPETRASILRIIDDLASTED